MHLYVEPMAGTSPVVRVIQQATNEVDLNVYLLDDRSVLRAIRDAVRRGVRVRVMLTRHPYRMRAYKIREEFRRVEQTGATVQAAPHRFRFDHAKYVCNDTECQIGTANYTWSAFHRNREYLLVTREARIVHATRAVFNADWQHIRAGSAPRQILVLSPHSTHRVVEAIRQAGPVDIEQEELGSDYRIMDALKAKGREVRLILPSSAQRRDGRRLRALRYAGVRVRFMPHRLYMHAKLIAGRQIGFIGSENFSYNSLNHNRELGLLIHGRPLKVAREQFDADWQMAR